MLIALVGRTNVGKSTLFNNLTRNRQGKAITHNLPNVTRDYKEGKGRLFDLNFDLIDTAGLERITLGEDIVSVAAQRSIDTLKKADLVLFVVDALVGICALDQEIADLVRKIHPRVLLVANKCEKGASIYKEFYDLGFGEPIKVSATQTVGFQELRDAISQYYTPPSDEASAPESKALKLAIVGRPNSGKSTLINALLKQERLVTSNIAGTTRDAIDITWHHKDRLITLIDTAGLRKKSRIDDTIELLSSKQALRAIERCDVCVIVIDAERGIEDQELKIAELALNKQKSLVITVNKWDLVKEKKIYKNTLSELLLRKLSQIKGIPVAYISAQKGKGVTDPIDYALHALDKASKKISTSKLNLWLRNATSQRMPPSVKAGRVLKLKYCAQTSTSPLEFKIFTNYQVPGSYAKYLANNLRETFDLDGAPIKIIFAQSHNPYV